MEIGRILSSARLNRHEIAGSLGDMGTFLPLLVACLMLRSTRCLLPNDLLLLVG